MVHTHDFEHQPSEDGFDGLGTKEDSSVSDALSQTVFYTMTRCGDRNCSVSEYRSYLFNIDSFDICCDDVHPEEPAESMNPEIDDFIGDREGVVVEFTCRHCGDTQTIKSDHVYTSES